MRIYRGAEADIYKQKFLGMPAIFKIRKKKQYLHSQLDTSLRKNREKTEVRMLSRARRAVNTPHVLFDGNGLIIMEYVSGETVRELFKKGVLKHATLIGREIKKLHNVGIVHNDLTTSNMLVSNGKLYFIDFGLAQSNNTLENRAVDLIVLKHMLSSTHYDVFDGVWPKIVKGYALEKPMARKMNEIETRAKYR